MYGDLSDLSAGNFNLQVIGNRYREHKCMVYEKIFIRLSMRI